MIRSFTGPRVIAAVGVMLITVACTVERPDAESDRGTAGSPDTSPAVCRRTADGEAGDLALARCLATPELTPKDGAAASPVVVYFDRSGSMRGFLDPKYPTRVPTDYRAVIDRLVVGLRPARGFSFGNALRSAEPTLAT